MLRRPCSRLWRGRRLSRSALLCLLPLLLSACGKRSVEGRPELVPVAGMVLFDGQPSQGATVVFAPEGHQFAATAKTDGAGRFELMTFDPGDGAVPGNYKVTVSLCEVIPLAGGAIREEHHLPKRYLDFETSGLTATVTAEGPNDIRLELSH